MNLAGKRVFLTGSTGYIGRNLVDALNQAGAKMILLQDDVRTFDYPKGPIDYVIHAALRLGVEMWDIGINGTARVWRLAQEKNARMLYVSSGAVYRWPRDPYAMLKIQAEESCQGAVIARLFSVLGPYIVPERYAAGRFIMDGLINGAIHVQDGRHVYRSYLHARDMAEIILDLLDAEPGVHDVGSNEPISIYDLALKVGRVMRLPVIPIEGKEILDEFIPRNGQTPKRGLCEAIKDTVEWLKK